MTCIDNNEIDVCKPSFLQVGWNKTGAIFKAMMAQNAELRQQKQTRKAFMNLVGKEDWVYRDLGLCAADVEWAARLPLHINAAAELEKRRCAGLIETK